MRAVVVTYSIIVGRTNAGQLALVNAVHVELLKDGVRGGGARKKSGGRKACGLHTEY